MALIKCKECGELVSEKAKACPHCGVPLSSGAGFHMFIAASLGLILLVVLFIGDMLTFKHDEGVEISRKAHAEMITKLCVEKIGMNPNDKNHRMTAAEALAIENCAMQAITNTGQ